MNDSNTPTHEQITRRAYEIFIERGQPEGRDLEHWLEAEKQLRAGKSKSAPPMTAAASAPSAPSPIRATQPAASSSRAGNGKTSSSRPAARK